MQEPENKELEKCRICEALGTLCPWHGETPVEAGLYKLPPGEENALIEKISDLIRGKK